MFMADEKFVVFIRVRANVSRKPLTTICEWIKVWLFSRIGAGVIRDDRTDDDVDVLSDAPLSENVCKLLIERSFFRLRLQSPTAKSAIADKLQ